MVPITLLVCYENNKNILIGNDVLFSTENTKDPLSSSYKNPRILSPNKIYTRYLYTNDLSVPLDVYIRQNVLERHWIQKSVVLSDRRGAGEIEPLLP